MIAGGRLPVLMTPVPVIGDAFAARSLLSQACITKMLRHQSATASFMSTNEIVAAVTAFVGLFVGAGIVIKIRSGRNNSNRTVIKRNKTGGGDIAGRDIKK